ncbi:elongation factor P maturation arginine rhamnosyltransferase EarP [Thiosulfativibrio zosterae]|nr:elongation factor P maturation arginine rhamnosyltransferase EarP [Thiosulfativibrio zosterae]
MSFKRRWDIFCTVIDNYGDIGVCWRLAKLLVQVHQQAVRLWVDDLAALQKLHPNTQIDQAKQWLEGVEVCHWTSRAFDMVSMGDVAEVVIEAFGCELPIQYQQAMGQKGEASCVWINLEYLTAEPWAAECHGLGALQNNGVKRHFFFPGMTKGTGGLMCEPDYEVRRMEFLNSLTLQQRFCQRWNLPFDGLDDAIKVSLFAYENQGLLGLLDAFKNSSRRVVAFLPEGKLLNDLNAQLGLSLQAGQTWQTAQLTLVVMPFLPQAAYDELLWLCDLNFVRGEESFVRAQLAAKPFVWHIYPTEDQAHFDKLDAFLAIYPTLAILKQANVAWNQEQWHLEHWHTMVNVLPELLESAESWQNSIKQLGELSENLMTFAKKL